MKKAVWPAAAVQAKQPQIMGLETKQPQVTRRRQRRQRAVPMGMKLQTAVQKRVMQQEGKTPMQALAILR